MSNQSDIYPNDFLTKFGNSHTIILQGYGNVKAGFYAKTIILDFDGYDWMISTHKVLRQGIQCKVSIGKFEILENGDVTLFRGLLNSRGKVLISASKLSYKKAILEIHKLGLIEFEILVKNKDHLQL